MAPVNDTASILVYDTITYHDLLPMYNRLCYSKDHHGIAALSIIG